MKKMIMPMAFVLLAAMTGPGLFAQETEKAVEPIPSIVFAPNILGPLFGYYSGSFNFPLGGKLALETELTYWNIKNIPILGDQINPDFEFWLGQFKAGPTFYPQSTFRGLFGGAYLKGSRFEVGPSTSRFLANSFGAGVKGGWRGTWDWFSLALGAGYEYTKSTLSVSQLEAAKGDDTSAAFLSAIEGGAPYFILNMEIALY